MSEWIPVARAADVTTDSPLPASADGVDLVLLKTTSGIGVFQGRCPHQGTFLSGGAVKAGCLECPSHAWTFDLATGAKKGDDRVRLQKFECRERDGMVEVEAAHLRRWREAQREPAARSAKPSRSWKDLPGPPPVPILGNAHHVDPPRIHKTLERWARTYGPIFRFRLFGKHFIGVAEPEAIQEILRNRPEGFRRLGSIEGVFQEMGANGVFSTEGAAWNRQRALTVPAFNSAHLIPFFPTLTQVTDRLRRRWQGPAERGTNLDIAREFQRFTVDVTTALAFGYDMNTLENDADPIQRHLEHVFPAIARRVNAPFPYWRTFRLPRDRALDRALVAIRAAVQKTIEARREAMTRDPGLKDRPTNFLELFLAHSDSGRMSDEDVFANVVTILAAGEDTTANSLAWILHFLVEYPDVQERMREEVLSVLGNTPLADSPALLDKLKFTEAVTHEAMRLKPVAPVIFLEAARDSVVGDLGIPLGTGVMVLTAAASVDERNFSRPLEFEPERWFPGNSARFPRHNLKAFLPFGAGPRFCPGRNLALIEIKAVLAMILRHFRVKAPSHKRPPEEKFIFVAVPVGLEVKLEAL